MCSHWNRLNEAISQYKKENHPKLSQTCNNEICSKGPKNEFEIAVVNKPSVFEPLKFYCNAFLFLRYNVYKDFA